MSESTANIPIAQAVTAVFTCTKNQQTMVFMVRRQPHLLAFPGYWAFPGGKVEPDDLSQPFDHDNSAIAAIDPDHRYALQRELEEELNWSLTDAIASGEALSISRFGHAISPAFVPKRFDTWFYQVELNQTTVFDIDVEEASEGGWLPLADYLSSYQNGLRLVAPPTLAVLQALHGNKVPATAGQNPLKFQWDAKTEIACLQPLNGLRLLPVRSHTLPPATHTNCFVIGDAAGERIAVDPSPDSDEELSRLLTTLRPLGICEIVITHHHGDHNERADALARQLNVPLRMSHYTQQRLAAAKPEFFDAVSVQLCETGNTVAHWLGQPVVVIAVPGHDEGQIALAPKGENPAWCIVGDLIQGVGSVVICPPEGNMLKYFRTMQAMIDLNPAVILPSHGMAMGSTYRLQATLDHRQQRETAIVEHLKHRRSEDEMLAAMYQGTHPKLLPLARINIQAHIEKLREESALP